MLYSATCVLNRLPSYNHEFEAGTPQSSTASPCSQRMHALTIYHVFKWPSHLLVIQSTASLCLDIFSVDK